MFAIVNVGGGNAEDHSGERTYEVRINRQVITSFRHKRADGLAACLMAASLAVKKTRSSEITRALLELADMAP